MIKNWFLTKNYSCKFSQKLIVKKIQIGIIFPPVLLFLPQKWPFCIFLTINFCANLHEHFFVHNQFLSIKKSKKKYLKCSVIDLFEKNRILTKYGSQPEFCNKVILLNISTYFLHNIKEKINFVTKINPGQFIFPSFF